MNAPGTLTSSGDTYPNGINDADQVVGSFETTYGGVEHGFLYQNGTFTTLDDPDAGTQDGQGTVAVDINNSGVDRRYYFDSSGQVQASSIRQPDDINPALSPPSTIRWARTARRLLGINNAGQIVGDYTLTSTMSSTASSLRSTAKPPMRMRHWR